MRIRRGWWSGVVERAAGSCRVPRWSSCRNVLSLAVALVAVAVEVAGQAGNGIAEMVGVESEETGGRIEDQMDLTKAVGPSDFAFAGARMVKEK